MVYFSALLKQPKYRADAERLFSALTANGEAFSLIKNTRDIWIRDFMPIKTRKGRYISFRYEPSYLVEDEHLRTEYRDIASQFDFDVTYSSINLDGGNVVFSPSKEKALISNRIFSENPAYEKNELVDKLSKLLEAEVVIIEALKSDMTGHADGMVRFVSEDTVLINKTNWKKGLEQRQKIYLEAEVFKVIEFPYHDSHCGKDATGSYLNYLETPCHIFFPIFDVPEDEIALSTARKVFSKKVLPVKITEIPKDGGVFNCISWED